MRNFSKRALSGIFLAIGLQLFLIEIHEVSRAETEQVLKHLGTTSAGLSSCPV